MRYLALKVSLVACAASFAFEAPAFAQPADDRTRACIEDNRVAQEEMLAGHYESAKKHAQACAVDSCAKVLRDDCRQIADNASQKLEKSSDVKPGSEPPPAPVAVPQGTESPSTEAGSDGSPPPTEGHDVVDKPSRVPSYVLFGVAAVAAGSFGFFALSGRSKENDLTCDTHCSDSELDPITRNYLIADVSLGISLAALAGGLILWPWGSERQAAAIRVSPREVRLRVSF